MQYVLSYLTVAYILMQYVLSFLTVATQSIAAALPHRIEHPIV